MNGSRSPQHRTTLLLLVNHGLNASTGIVFWLFFIHLVGLDAAAIGLGYTVVAVATAVGLVAKGGLTTALLRHVPLVDGPAGRRLLRVAVIAGAGLAIAATASLAGVLRATPPLSRFTNLDWLFVGAIAGLLVVAWLQDAFFLAQGRPGATVWRNITFSAAKLLVALPLLVVAAPSPVAGAWAVALAVAAGAGYWMARGPAGAATDDRLFFRSAWRNVLGNAAEFLPGLLLVPLVLMRAGADAAGHFSMAWTTASLLFLAATAIGRSALTHMVRGDPHPETVRRALLQGSALIVPGALLAMALASPVLRLFGADYVAAATTAFLILCGSAVFLLPIYVYLDVLRAREATVALNAFPLAIIALLFAMAPPMISRFGVTGAAMAWFAANLPFTVWSVIRLRDVTKEVRSGAAEAFGHHPHSE